MKTFKLTALALLLSATAAFGQKGNKDMSDRWVVSNLKTKQKITEDGETYTVKQLEITEEYTPVMLDPNDKKKLNQDIIYLPTQVSKRIRLDNDKDISYDREVKFNYLKSKKVNLDFTLTRKGIAVKTDSKTIHLNKITHKTGIMHTVVNNRIQKEGIFTLELSNGEKVDITVSSYKMM